jgi:SRSO17 transposase
MTGLLSKLQRKTGEAIAYLHDRERQGLQKFVGHVPWDHRPLLAMLARRVGSDLGEPDAVLVFDPSACAQKEPSKYYVQLYSGSCPDSVDGPKAKLEAVLGRPLTPSSYPL